MKILLAFGLSLWISLAGRGYAIPNVVRTPEHRFENLSKLGYPWKPSYLNINIPGKPPALRMAYLDSETFQPRRGLMDKDVICWSLELRFNISGSYYHCKDYLGPKKEVILLLHGAFPGASFMFRKMIRPLQEAKYRVIVPDLIGYGQSDKLTNVTDYSLGLHVQSLLQLIEHLNLKNISLWAHDLGGLVGLSAVRAQPFRFQKIILFNTPSLGDLFFKSLKAIEASVKPVTHSVPLFYRGYIIGYDTTERLRPVHPVEKLISDEFLNSQTFGPHHPVEEILRTMSNISSTDIKGYTAPYPLPYYMMALPAWFHIVTSAKTAYEWELVYMFLLNIPNKFPVLFGWGEQNSLTPLGRLMYEDLFNRRGCKVNIPNAANFLPDEDAKRMSLLTIRYIHHGCQKAMETDLSKSENE